MAGKPTSPPAADKPPGVAALAQLRRAVGAACVETGEAARFQASLDNSRLSFMPDAVVRPADAAGVGALLRLANRQGVPVTARGAGSGTTGGAAPLRGGWVVDLSHWKELEIDGESALARVQPGVTPHALNQAAERAGLFYPPDPSSLKYATLGGTLATNAGGPRGAKYGVTRDYVLALEGCLPTGEFVRWGAPLRKFVSGYNLRDLWVGSEGTLGIITAATLRLIPKPGKRWMCALALADEATALDLVRTILQTRLQPSVLEFLDRQTVGCAQHQGGGMLGTVRRASGFTGETPALLIVEFDGSDAVLRRDRKRFEALLAEAGVTAFTARSERQCEELWQIRRTCSQAMFSLGDTKLNEDIVVPLRSYRALLDYTLELRRETGLGTPTFGHAADGNFHVHLMFNRAEPAQRRAAERGLALLMRKVVELGGAITGEHGIGLAKSPFLELQHSRAEIQVMRAIKDALDPNGILNPGKIFEPFRVWEHEPVDVTLPWDHR